MHPSIHPQLQDQAGVVARRQILAAGLLPHDIARLLRRRELSMLHPGIYVDHTGEPTWLQRAWGAVLHCWPAALSHESALRCAEGPGSHRSGAVLHVAVDRDRAPRPPQDVRVHRMADLEPRAMWHLGPPRIRYEHATIDVAAAARSDFEALGELSRAVQGRRTTAQRLLATVAERERIARRTWLTDVLTDVAEGACSTLEHGYLVHVERAHGLSGARRQVRDRAGAGVVHRDVEYQGGLVVELDGRLFHDTTAQRDRDFDRDLEAAVAGKRSVRLSWGQVVARPCWTAGRVAVLLRRRGWQGRPRRCGPDCDLELPVW